MEVSSTGTGSINEETLYHERHQYLFGYNIKQNLPFIEKMNSLERQRFILTEITPVDST